MTPERWQQIDRLFHAALDRELTQRHSFLSEVCAGDEALLKELESLISAHEHPGEFMEQPAGDLAADLLGSTPARLVPGLTIGPYRVVRLLGAARRRNSGADRSGDSIQCRHLTRWKAARIFG